LKKLDEYRERWFRGKGKKAERRERKIGVLLAADGFVSSKFPTSFETVVRAERVVSWRAEKSATDGTVSTISFRSERPVGRCSRITHHFEQ